MIIEEDLRAKVADLQNRTKDTLTGLIGIKFTTYKRDEVVATMPVDDRTKQPFGILHGGASVALAEALASIGAWLNVDETKYNVVGIEINANHIRAVTSGIVTGTATPLHRGRTTHVWEVKIRTEDGKLVCASRCTLALVVKQADKATILV